MRAESLNDMLKRHKRELADFFSRPQIREKRPLSALIREERAKQGLCLDEVAELAEMSKTQIWELEKGRSKKPSVLTCAKLAAALCVPFEHVCAAALNPEDG